MNILVSSLGCRLASVMATTRRYDQLRVLDKASAPSLGFPHDLLRRDNVTIGTYGDQWRLVDDRTQHVAFPVECAR
jgi:hypothetical protein